MLVEVKMLTFTHHDINNPTKHKICHPVELHKLRPMGKQSYDVTLACEDGYYSKTHLVMFSTDNPFFQIIVYKCLWQYNALHAPHAQLMNLSLKI